MSDTQIHTEGPLERDTRGFPHADVKAVSGRAVAHTWMAQGRQPKTAKQYERRVKEDRGNARRIVACWNAFVGIPTEEVEALTPVGAEGTTQVATVIAQRDKLLAALEETLPALIRLGDFVGNHDKGGPSGQGEIDRCGLILSVRDVIRETKGVPA